MSMSRRARNAAETPPPPDGCTSIDDILDGEVSVGKMVHLCCVVKDCRAPIPTKGKDHKMTVKVFDHSTQQDGRSIDITIFRPVDQMPEFNAGDAVLAFNVKVQEFGGNISVITHNKSSLNVYSGILLPKPSDNRSASVALKSNPKVRGRSPSEKDNAYVSYMYHHLDKDCIPDQETFQAEANQSLNIRDKFSTLENITEGNFYDIIVQLVKDPFDQFGTLTCYVTDYTTNGRFFNHTPDGKGRGGTERDGDPYNYTAKFQTSKIVSGSAWPGPYGQMSMQLTCWDPHAMYIKENKLGAGTWVRLQNVNIKYGRNGTHLEGFLRQDQKYPDRVKVEILEVNDYRLKDALRRKQEYEKPNKRKSPHDHNTRVAQQAQVRQGPDAAREKEQRKEDIPAENSNQRRKRLRLEKQRAAELAQKRKEEEALGLNSLVRCENLSQEASPISRLLEPVYYETNVNGQEIRFQIPFNNVNYRTNVRVVDFRPERLEDFSICRPRSRYSGDVSDDSSLSGLDDDEDSSNLEWCFWLQVEDAMAFKNREKRPEERVWVMVDNLAAQCLGLDDAVDLRQNPNDLSTLREKMSTLWGNLEELKRERLESRRDAARRRNHLTMPPLSSEGNGTTPDPDLMKHLCNDPFSCCIKQYGVKERTDDPKEADAGPGRKWVRVFGLFGTKICA
ncbi:hypothetical protein MCOR25_003118 [Pyricularia grisea]|uniref:Protection of telomeres protein 1 n=1 Tax=Pyricularia grisea TaxID=148305 RepID=A0A6P8B976_PYRGI|nr:uncharacterized protein PgNI_03299 [Pyricularia grisea]KAI6374654.1 hypothetical protein MCOR25_003118 [Pyricularia grisea]TLD12388.1 hypothetical protein PgNI_03299 [Pyricularia grisea]